MDGIHLLRPTGSGLELAHGADLVERVARDADVVVALEDDLDVADVEGRVCADLGQAAGGCDDVVYKVVCEGEDGLWREEGKIKLANDKNLPCILLPILGRIQADEWVNGVWMLSTYLFNIRCQSVTFATACDLTDEFVELLLAQHTIAFAFEDETGLLGDGRLTHHTGCAITWAAKGGS